MNLDEALASIDYARWNLYVAQREARRTDATVERVAQVLTWLSVDLDKARQALAAKLPDAPEQERLGF